MEKNRKGKLFDAFAILVAFVSLGLNLLLLYNIYITPEKTPNTSEPTKTSYSKKELGEYFKNYQSKNGLAEPNNVVSICKICSGS